MFLVQLVMRYRGFIGERRRRFFPTSLRDTPDHLRKVTSAFITEFLINFHFKFVHCVAICLRIQLFSSIDSQYILLLANVVRKATIALGEIVEVSLWSQYVGHRVCEFLFFVLFCFLVGQNNHSIIFPLQFSTEILLFRPLQSIGDWMNA